MKLWRISQTVNTGYDTFDSAIVAAETEEAARLTHPGNWWFQDSPILAAISGYRWRADGWCSGSGPADPKSEAAAIGLGQPITRGDDWSHPADVKVELVGEAVEGTRAGAVLVASFNAG